MNKTEFIEAIADEAELSKAISSRALNAALNVITSQLSDGGQIVLPGFGTFSVGLRAARTGRNPNTGEEIKIKAARVAKFKAGKSLKDAVNEGIEA